MKNRIIQSGVSSKMFNDISHVNVSTSKQTKEATVISAKSTNYTL